MTCPFLARHPALFHVTDASALDGIRARGLLSARHLHDNPSVLRENRDGWIAGPGYVLRRQGMRDGALRPRLDTAISPAEWRWFINGLVFLFPTLRAAERLVASEPAREQVILRYDSHAVASAVPLRTCRFNNGYIDRAPVDTARRRRFDDYRPITGWAGEPVREAIAEGTIPASVGFAVIARSA